jgi:hypothetical protein
MFTGTVYFKMYETKANRTTVHIGHLQNNLLKNKNKTEVSLLNYCGFSISLFVSVLIDHHQVDPKQINKS